MKILPVDPSPPPPITLDKVLRALSVTDSVAEAAQRLDISLQYIYQIMAAHGVSTPHYEDCVIRYEGIIEMIQEGYLVKDIAREYKLSPHRIREIAREAGVTTFDAAYEKLRIQAILDGLKKGKTVKEMAAQFELSPSTVYYHRLKLKEGKS
ncbi:hypothetical protein B9Y60_10565 [Stenotrophomonas maltophilia]|uniref:hypothetical protein n=1 Tax=Stenotrophomonas maltophilia TaxID=40324 RepID=UPI000C268192|nr:hypothetical protein [Stenotrophomonas maltophilia]PJL52197.1 hypothetical protein B9Y73_10565 [Stenotrophomonas maltophilia]PJL55118.1 hypothetical protein B9Y60_10565 [Stenotrophomonas maltophilia]